MNHKKRILPASRTRKNLVDSYKCSNNHLTKQPNTAIYAKNC